MQENNKNFKGEPSNAVPCCFDNNNAANMEAKEATVLAALLNNMYLVNKRNSYSDNYSPVSDLLLDIQESTGRNFSLFQLSLTFEILLKNGISTDLGLLREAGATNYPKPDYANCADMRRDAHREACARSKPNVGDKRSMCNNTGGISHNDYCYSIAPKSRNECCNAMFTEDCSFN